MQKGVLHLHTLLLVDHSSVQLESIREMPVLACFRKTFA